MQILLLTLYYHNFIKQRVETGIFYDGGHIISVEMRLWLLYNVLGYFFKFKFTSCQKFLQIISQP